MPPPKRTAAIILAAGFSSRMGAFKPLMDVGGTTVLDRVVNLYTQAGVSDIRVVVGHGREDIRSALAGRSAVLVPNPDFADGMYSSVVAGIQSLPENIGTFFIHPVDIALVRPHTIRTLMAALHNHPTRVVSPEFDRHRGHPPLIHKDALPAIRNHDGRGGLRAVLNRLAPETRRVPVADQGILLDLDTPEDARALTARLKQSYFLTPAECRVLLENVLQVEATVVNHCRKVADVARALAKAVEQNGVVIDTGLTYASARVHDLAKGRPDHAAVGAALLRQMDFPAMAGIVAAHMNIAVSDHAPLDESQIVYLADKLVAGTAIVGLTRQFDAKLKHVGHDPDIAARIRERRRAALEIGNKVVRASGRSLADIVQHASAVSENNPCIPS